MLAPETPFTCSEICSGSTPGDANGFRVLSTSALVNVPVCSLVSLVVHGTQDHKAWDDCICLFIDFLLDQSGHKLCLALGSIPSTQILEYGNCLASAFQVNE